MTTVAFRDGVMASDSQGNDACVGIVKLQKLFRKKIKNKEHIIGVAGHWEAALLFIDWYGTTDKDLFDRLLRLPEDSGFDILIWTGKRLLCADKLMRMTECNEDYYAIGSGASYAVTAMDCGKTAAQAVGYAIKRDNNSGGRVVTMSLAETKKPA
jgi:ATP-dependent protease HslVU (ClpYQ) peptidase subunit